MPSPAASYFDVTDLIEFYTRGESPSGVQRVVAGVAPGLMGAGIEPILLDRSRGVFTIVGPHAAGQLLTDRVPGTPATAGRVLAEASVAPPVAWGPGDLLLLPGAAWINDALMLAVRAACAMGARLVAYLYDLTPVLQAGHTAAVNQLFERYLTLVAQEASRAPAISRATRRDFEAWCLDRGLTAPGGVGTGLPNALDPDDFPTTESPWPRDYALCVGTIESRKNHIVALHAWRRLIELHGADNVPDLVCVGRLGWHADAFLEEMVMTKGLGGKVSMLTGNVSDADVAALYRHARFTVYPSSYEGWGLPVSESLAFGVPVVSADNSSLREAGGESAIYVSTGDVDALVTAIEGELLTEGNNLAARRRLLESAHVRRTWEQVVATLVAECESARSEAREGSMTQPVVEVGREYMLAPRQPRPDGGHADVYLAHLVANELTPLLRQPRGDADFAVMDGVLTGQFGAPQTWGLEVRPGRSITVRFNRPVEGDLRVLLATRSMPGVVTVESTGPGGVSRDEVYLGSVLTINAGSGRAGDPAQATFRVVDAHDSVEGFLGIRSLVILHAEDHRTQVLALESAAQALRQELDFITGTRSWRITAPLRSWKGRGSSAR